MSDKQGILYIIPTPIGNLDDITLRAIKTLKEVDILFVEDTRVTKILLNHLNITKKLISNNLYNEKQNVAKLLKLLNEGLMVGLVSDRGTPVISDPGYELVKGAIDNNYKVIALPGPVAFIPALITSSLSPLPFLFYGFLNNKESIRNKELEKLKELEYTLIFYEAPHRLKATLNNMLLIFGNRKISLAKEISKKYEEVYRGNIKDVISKFQNIKGEFVIIVEQNKKMAKFEHLTIIEHVNLYLKEGLNQMEAIKAVAKERKIAKSIVYKQYHK